MNVFNKEVEIVRPVFTIFFIIDTSACMAGERIAMLNIEMLETIPFVRNISIENPDIQIKIAVLESSNHARWITNGPIEVEQFVWICLDAGGNADFGAAFETLNDKLSRQAFMQSQSSFSPLIIFISDGINMNAGEKPFIALQMLKNNKWFKEGIKAAIATGNDANIDLLAEFTGSMDSVKKIKSGIIQYLIKEAMGAIWICLDRPIDLEYESDLQMIFNDRIKNFHQTGSISTTIPNNDVNDDDWF